MQGSSFAKLRELSFNVKVDAATSISLVRNEREFADAITVFPAESGHCGYGKGRLRWKRISTICLVLSNTMAINTLGNAVCQMMTKKNMTTIFVGG